MVHPLDLVPGEAGRVLDDLRARRAVTVSDHIEPVAMAPVLRLMVPSHI